MYEFLIAISILIFVIVLFVYVRHPACAFHHPVTIYLGFHATVFIFRPIVSIIYGFDAIYKAVGFYPSASDRETVLIATNLALIVFVWVALKVGGPAMVWRQTEVERIDRTRWIKYFWAMAVPLGLLGLYALLWQWRFEASSGDINTMNMQTGVRTLNGVSGYFLILSALPGTICVICAYLYRFRLASLIPYAGFGVLRLGTGGRSDFIAATIMIVVLFLYDQRRRWPDLRSVIIGVVAVFAFTSVAHDRGAAIREAFGLEGVNANRVWSKQDYKPFEQADTAMLEAFEFVVYAVPQRSHSYDYFANNLRIFTEPIPRTWWKNKPAGSPVQFFYLYDYGRPIAMALSMPGVGWLSLGYLGVAIWSALFAFAYGKAYAAFVRGRQGNIAVLTFAIIISTALFAYRDGLLLTIIKFGGVYFIPLVVMIGIGRLMKPELLSRSQRYADANPRRASAPEPQRIRPRALRSAAVDPARLPRARRPG